MSSLHAVVTEKIMNTCVSLNRTFVIVPPFRTSSVCPECLEDVNSVPGSTRYKVCTSPQHGTNDGLFWSRDVLGAYDTAYIAWCRLHGFETPHAFRKQPLKDLDEE
jgi:hypothetical protein